jgi:xanthine/CO dehydrogenase XdhC/CoxF family maturation factor
MIAVSIAAELLPRLQSVTADRVRA